MFGSTTVAPLPTTSRMDMRDAVFAWLNCLAGLAGIVTAIQYGSGPWGFSAAANTSAHRGDADWRWFASLVDLAVVAVNSVLGFAVVVGIAYLLRRRHLLNIALAVAGCVAGPLAMTDGLLMFADRSPLIALVHWRAGLLAGLAIPHIYCAFLFLLLLTEKVWAARRPRVQQPATLTRPGQGMLGTFHILTALAGIIVATNYTVTAFGPSTGYINPFGSNFAPGDRMAFLLAWTTALVNYLLGAGMVIGLACWSRRPVLPRIPLTLAAIVAVLAGAAAALDIFAETNYPEAIQRWGRPLLPALAVPCVHCVVVFLWLLIERARRAR